MPNSDEGNQQRVQRMQMLVSKEFVVSATEAAYLGVALLHETVGSGHPVAQLLNSAIEKGDFNSLQSGSKAVIGMYEEGRLISPRLAIAHEIEGDLLDIAQKQVEAAEKDDAVNSRTILLGIASFLAGAAIEDALRRICEANEIGYDAGNTSISKLQGLLYRPSDSVEIISRSETKQITAWGDTRNKADHGRLEEITQAETAAMVIGVRAFLDRHLP